MENKKKVSEKWEPFLQNNFDGGIIPYTGTTEPISGDTSFLPIAIRVCSQTIGLDLVQVAPMGGINPHKHKTQERMKKLKKVLGDSFHDVVSKEEYEEAMKVEETFPKGILFYSDFKYETPKKSKFERFKDWFRNLFRWKKAR